MMKDILFREKYIFEENEDLENNPFSDLKYEIFGIQNHNAVDTILSRFASKAQSEEIYNKLKHLYDKAEKENPIDGEPEEYEQNDFINELLNIIETRTKKKIKTVLTLETWETLKNHFEDNEDEPDDINAYKEGDILLWCEKGISLYAYETIPKPEYQLNPVLTIISEDIGDNHLDTYITDETSKHLLNTDDKYTIIFHDFDTRKERDAYLLAMKDLNSNDTLIYTWIHDIDILNEDLDLNIEFRKDKKIPITQTFRKV